MLKCVLPNRFIRPDARLTMKGLLQNCFNQALFWSSCLTTDSKLSGSGLKKQFFINEHIAFLNYSLFRNLKSKKIQREENNLANFEGVCTFQGKVLCEDRKVCWQLGRFAYSNKLLLTHLSQPLGYVTHYCSAANNSSCPQDEIAALLPSTAQQGGYTVSLHSDHEAHSAATTQQRDHIAPPQSEQGASLHPSTYNARA